MVTRIRFNLKGYSEFFQSEFAQTFNIWWRANSFRLMLFYVTFLTLNSIFSVKCSNGISTYYSIVRSIHIKIRICILSMTIDKRSLDDLLDMVKVFEFKTFFDVSLRIKYFTTQLMTRPSASNTYLIAFFYCLICFYVFLYLFY
jgi:hypothetical protein